MGPKKPSSAGGKPRAAKEVALEPDVLEVICSANESRRLSVVIDSSIDVDQPDKGNHVRDRWRVTRPALTTKRVRIAGARLPSLDLRASFGLRLRHVEVALSSDRSQWLVRRLRQVAPERERDELRLLQVSYQRFRYLDETDSAAFVSIEAVAVDPPRVWIHQASVVNGQADVRLPTNALNDVRRIRMRPFTSGKAAVGDPVEIESTSGLFFVSTEFRTTRPLGLPPNIVNEVYDVIQEAPPIDP